MDQKLMPQSLNFKNKLFLNTNQKAMKRFKDVNVLFIIQSLRIPLTTANT